jgi:uncharacterized protein
MAPTVVATDDPTVVLTSAGAFLRADPVRHNVILTLLHARVTRPEPGRYWVSDRDGDVTGVVFQSPLSFPATITPMDAATVESVVDAIADAGKDMPGVGGEAGSAARFAGHWTERHGSAAHPTRGQRIYEVTAVRMPDGVRGTVRRAVQADGPQLVTWLHAFHAETGTTVGDAEAAISHRVAAGQCWVWDDDGPVSMASVTAPVAGVARVQAVYTPPEHRDHGYGSACVARLSIATLDGGHRCILYTDLGNATSNAIYRQLGYRAVAEVLRYRFD